MTRQLAHEAGLAHKVGDGVSDEQSSVGGSAIEEGSAPSTSRIAITARGFAGITGFAT